VGKLVVATNSLEEERLLELWERANHLVRQSLNVSHFSDEQVGKLVVATNKLEEERLLDLWERANQNGVPDIQLLDSR
jgi:L-2-hydroxyglutarate oxidase LhgO